MLKKGHQLKCDQPDLELGTCTYAFSRFIFEAVNVENLSICSCSYIFWLQYVLGFENDKDNLGSSSSNRRIRLHILF